MFGDPVGRWAATWDRIVREEDLASLNRIGPVDARLLLEHLLARPPDPSTGSSQAEPGIAPHGTLYVQRAVDVYLLSITRDEIDDGPDGWVSQDSIAEFAIDDAGPPGAEAPPGIPLVRPPSLDDMPEPAPRRNSRYGVVVATIVSVMVATVGWHFATGPDVCRVPAAGVDEAGRLAADVVARRIVTAESGGDANATNARSSATGSGQFLDGTWLDMIRAYRPDLAGGSDTQILDLRRNPDLSREMVARFAEQNAAMLVRRCLPVTPGTLYLSHFAGGGGAAAVLQAPETADAAGTMAAADSTGRTTRDMIVTANPFLEAFTVADLKRWADRKMRIAAGDRVSRM